MTLPPEYQPRYVSFIDVLGFADRVENIGKDHTVFDQILNINSVIDEAAVEARKLGAAFNRDDVQWTAFSDTVVLSLPESGHAMPDLFMFMISTAALCQNLLSSEILTPITKTGPYLVRPSSTLTVSSMTSRSLQGSS